MGIKRPVSCSQLRLHSEHLGPVLSGIFDISQSFWSRVFWWWPRSRLARFLQGTRWCIRANYPVYSCMGLSSAPSSRRPPRGRAFVCFREAEFHFVWHRKKHVNFGDLCCHWFSLPVACCDWLKCKRAEWLFCICVCYMFLSKDSWPS